MHVIVNLLVLHTPKGFHYSSHGNARGRYARNLPNPGGV